MQYDKALKRDRIEKELDNLFKYPLTIVSATMGYGKTTSVRTYLNRCKVNLAWVSLLGSDGDETVFWKKLSSALERLYPITGKQLARLGFPLDAIQVSSVIELLYEIENDKNTVIVIDDYHIISEDKQIGKLVELIVQEDIKNLHIILISRTRPKFNHINLMSKGLCYFIDTETLAFTMQEIEEYFDFMGYPAALQDIKKIYSYTNGWISAIYLMLLGIQQGHPLNQTSNINQLIESNLFCTLDSETQEILLGLSVFDSFTLRQGTAVLDNSNVPKVIQKLEELNAFVEFDGQTGYYRLHNVLLDFLRKKLDDNNISLNEISHRAGKWYYDQGNINAAIDFYYRAGKIEELLQFLNNPEIADISFLGYKLHQKIHAGLQKDLCIKYPFPFLQMASNFIISGEPEVVMQGIEIACTMQEYFLKNVEVPEKLRKKILGELEVISLFMAYNDSGRMMEHVYKAYKLLGDGASCVVFRSDEFTFGIPHFLYTYYREAGKLKATLDSLSQGFPQTIFNGCGAGSEYVVIAEYALEKGDYNNVEFYARKSIYKAKTKMQIGVIICAGFSLMRLYLACGKYLEAVEVLTKARQQLLELREDMTAQNNAVYNTTMDMCEGYIYGCLKKYDLIPEWLRTGDMSNAIFMMNGMTFSCIVYGKAVMLSEKWVELEILCEGFKESYNTFHNQLGSLHNAIYDSVAKYKLYGIEKGIQALLPALLEAKLDGIVLPFAENADFILPMLYELYKEERVDSSWIKLLIEACLEYSNNLKAPMTKTSLLTNREIEVLNLLAQGLTQREIAGRLYISVSAVKRYLESMYKKLGVNNKTAAINNAKDLNIF